MNEQGAASIFGGGGVDQPIVAEPLRAEATPLVARRCEAFRLAARDRNTPDAIARWHRAGIIDREGDLRTVGIEHRLGARMTDGSGLGCPSTVGLHRPERARRKRVVRGGA